ncbi:MAG TPA: aldehyde ferredoxin oxidoreductase N-terminal domain-containing protein, partial [Smithella sp.]|nr:aldehyde ferredoxin oxidoreductase N-terminal domain-containing protein [Smithella sp.]
MKYTKKSLFHGYANQILHVDLTSGKIEQKPLDEKVRDFFIGGRGLGLYLLHKKINAQTKADDAENPLIFAPGPLGGIPQFPGTSKCMAISLSPLTHIPGVSNFGGHFGAYLKYAGFDALEITGISNTNAMIVIDDFKKDIYITEAPAIDQVFELEKVIVDKFLQE